MLGWFGKLFGGRTAAEAERKNPVVTAAVQESAEVYARIPLRDFIDEDRRSELARDLFLEVNRICNSIDPVMTCREELASTMLKLALFQVLMVPPPPEHDASGLRVQPGISGELKEHLVSLSRKNDGLRTEMFRKSESDEFDDLWSAVQQGYWETCWRAETLNAVRKALGDVVEGDDWYEPFLHAVCVQCEHQYRWDLELPSAFDESVAREAPTTYSVFTDIVLSGVRNPVAEWRDYRRGSGVPMPDFNRENS